jgi:hypothetical protein
VARDGHDYQISRAALDAIRGLGRTHAAGDAAPAADSRAACAAFGAAAAAQGAALVELVARQEQTILELAGRVGWLQAELQQRDARLAALEAPREEQEASQHQTFFDAQAQPPAVSAEPADQVAPPPDPAPRPWWQRLLFG